MCALTAECSAQRDTALEPSLSSSEMSVQFFML